MRLELGFLTWCSCLFFSFGRSIFELDKWSWNTHRWIIVPVIIVIVSWWWRVHSWKVRWWLSVRGQVAWPIHSYFSGSAIVTKRLISHCWAASLRCLRCFIRPAILSWVSDGWWWPLRCFWFFIRCVRSIPICPICPKRSSIFIHLLFYLVFDIITLLS